MIAAIYARKSNEQTDRSKRTRSPRAKLNARARSRHPKGWTVAKEHICQDYGIGGAEFAKRPGVGVN